MVVPPHPDLSSAPPQAGAPQAGTPRATAPHAGTAHPNAPHATTVPGASAPHPAAPHPNAPQPNAPQSRTAAASPAASHAAAPVTSAPSAPAGPPDPRAAHRPRGWIHDDVVPAGADRDEASAAASSAPGPSTASGPAAASEATVGARIRAARRARGWTQDDLAAATGVTRSAVAQWETDRAGQIRANLTRIAAALDISVEALLTGATADPPPLTGNERALLRLYQECSPEDQDFLLRTARRLARMRG